MALASVVGGAGVNMLLPQVLYWSADVLNGIHGIHSA